MYCYTEETNLFVLLYPVVSNRKEHINVILFMSWIFKYQIMWSEFKTYSKVKPPPYLYSKILNIKLTIQIL